MLFEAELHYYKARVYDPKYGRFMQTDPIGSKDDLNLYAYVVGVPVNETDPNGQHGVMLSLNGFVAGTSTGGSLSSIGFAVSYHDGNVDAGIVMTGSEAVAAAGGGVSGNASVFTNDIKSLDEKGVTIVLAAGYVSGSVSAPIVEVKGGKETLGVPNVAKFGSLINDIYNHG